MDITIRYTPDCPNLAGMEQNLDAALRDAGIVAEVKREVVESLEEAERLGFIGSPTLLIEGKDPFDRPEAPPAFACRIYEGRIPSAERIAEAIQRQPRTS